MLQNPAPWLAEAARCLDPVLCLVVANLCHSSCHDVTPVSRRSVSRLRETVRGAKCQQLGLNRRSAAEQHAPSEILTAPAVLRGLDTDHDLKLTPEECGLHIDPNSLSYAVAAQMHARFMSFHPVLAALDADRDGEISSSEIDRAVASLKNLDRNHDGYLTADELLPFEMTVRAGLR